MFASALSMAGMPWYGARFFPDDATNLSQQLTCLPQPHEHRHSVDVDLVDFPLWMGRAILQICWEIGTGWNHTYCMEKYDSITPNGIQSSKSMSRHNHLTQFNKLKFEISCQQYKYCHWDMIWPFSPTHNSPHPGSQVQHKSSTFPILRYITICHNEQWFTYHQHPVFFQKKSGFFQCLQFKTVEECPGGHREWVCSLFWCS